MLKNTTNSQLTFVFIFITTLFLSACENSSTENNHANQTIEVSKESKSLNNKGVGEMGYFNYSKATETFQKLVKLSPNWELAQQNLAISLLNRQKPGDEETAMQMGEALSLSNENNLVAHYIVGILKFNQGLCDEALPRFNKIIAKDNTDAYAQYFAGQCQLQNGNIDKALDLYQSAIKTDSYLRSAYYGGFMAAQRLQKGELAKEMLASYQKLDANPRAKLAEIKYTRMGPKAVAQTNNSENKHQLNLKSSAPYFNGPKALSLDFNNVQTYGVVNLNQTPQPQLYLIKENELKIYDNFLESSQDLPEFTIKLNKGPHLVAWGDINNDNKIDVYITGSTDQLYLQSEKGFESVDMESFGFMDISSNAVRIVDADHDGDLDVLLLNHLGQFELWNNNLNNTFTALSEKTKLAPKDKFKSIFLHDLDSDRDTDIILLSEKKITILLNDRMWDYQIIQSKDLGSEISSFSMSDNDVDGKPELNVLLQNNRFDVFQLSKNSIEKLKSIDNISAIRHLSMDTNGNGLHEHVFTDLTGMKVFNELGEIQEQIMVNEIDSIKSINTINGPELLYSANQKLFYSAANANRSPFVLLNLSGKEDDANSVRSNFSGIGTRVVLHNRDFYSIGDSFQNSSGVDQDYQAINLAAGIQNTNDFIGIDWSDGVYQTELGLQSSQFHKITETQRQLSSCPVIFAWNNGQYEFVSDVLGVGGIGFAIGRHEYGQPRPWENYLLNNNQLSSENGVFKFKFTEPMEESAYLDEMQIQVIDVPNKWSVMLDERMQISEPIVTGDTLFYQSKIQPIQVLNSKNKDVTQQTSITDKVAVDIINNDKRFLGLVDEQVITMEFNDVLSGEYQLIMNGWVEYGYSQTMFAAWQAGLYAQAPTLEYKVDGEWKTLLVEFGYPAGMPRSASVPIILPESTRFLRIKTNMEIYFDELALVQTGIPKHIRQHDLKLHNAHLKQIGFPKRLDNKQRVPSYDYNEIEPFWDTRYMEGAYTQIGEVTELVNKQDNALAIIGAGEGIELMFVDDLPDLEFGFDRYYVLKFKGWAKDMDILTKGGEKLTPIPSTNRVDSEAQALNIKYNTRFKAGK